MVNLEAANDYEPYFEDLKYINDHFISYESMVSGFNRHLSRKDGNSLNTYVDEIYHKLHIIEWDIWNFKRSEDHINDIIFRLNIVIENCQNVISEIEAEIESLLETGDEGFSTLNELYENLRKDELDFINRIKNGSLQNSSNYLLVALHSRYTLKNHFDKIKAFTQKGTENKFQHNIKWQKTDTDFLELITALYESKSINNASKDLTRKDAILIFSQIFNLEIKDVESKLVRATERKKDTSPFLGMLKKEFDDYSQKKVKE